jgi:hypothetical protein
MSLMSPIAAIGDWVMINHKKDVSLTPGIDSEISNNQIVNHMAKAKEKDKPKKILHVSRSMYIFLSHVPLIPSLY